MLTTRYPSSFLTYPTTGKLSLKTTFAYGLGLLDGEAGREAPVYLQGRDQYWNNLTTTMDNPASHLVFEIDLDGPVANAGISNRRTASSKSMVHCQGKGLYCSDITVTISGRYVYSIRHRDDGVLGEDLSTLLVGQSRNVVPTYVPLAARGSGDGLEDFTAGYNVSFSATAADLFGNNIEVEYDILQSQFCSSLNTGCSEALQIPLTRLGTSSSTTFEGYGVYGGSYGQTRSGIYLLTVSPVGGVVVGAQGIVNVVVQPGGSCQRNVFYAYFNSSQTLFQVKVCLIWGL